MIATREPESPLWQFHLVNDGEQTIESAELVSVKYEWAETYVDGEAAAVHVSNLGSLGQALLWRDDGSAEARTDLWLRVTQQRLTTWLLFEFPKLYKQSGTELVAHPIRVEGPPGNTP